MVGFVLTILGSYIATTLFGYIVHWSLHQKWAGSFNQSHMTHHLKLYPASDYLSDKYRDAGKDSTPKFFFFAALPTLILPVILLHFLGVLTWGLTILAMCVMFGVGLMKNYLHDAFHIRNHVLTKVPVIKTWFNNLVRLHYYHHVDMSKNFGISTFLWDRVFKSFTK
jgi:sterol desaturase/sphingolipid hydroxylase (fatty acid hydroxylase superfamily)